MQPLILAVVVLSWRSVLKDSIYWVAPIRLVRYALDLFRMKALNGMGRNTVFMGPHDDRRYVR